MNTLVAHSKIHLDLSFAMLKEMIEYCPDRLWNEKRGGFVFWQQVLHALTGILYWTRGESGPFEEPFQERKVFPELDGEPIGKIAKDEMRGLAKAVERQIASFFSGKEDAWLTEKSAVYGKIVNIDVILGQIRHIQYHAGHCNAILREEGEKAVGWEDYFG